MSDAQIVEKIDTIEVAIQLERDQFADEYAVLNAERDRLAGISQGTAEQEAMLAERSGQLEKFREESMAKREEHVQSLRVFGGQENEQHVCEYNEKPAEVETALA